MTKILMVCLGNICRSPLAHGILQSKLNEDNFFVDSAGTSRYHIGEPPDTRSILVAKNHNIDISQQKARQFTSDDFDTFDIIYAMDQSNFDHIINMAKTDHDIKKVRLILDADKALFNKNVPDPYYGDINDFEEVFELLDNACNSIARSL